MVSYLLILNPNLTVDKIVMSDEKKAELKAKCLELATQNSKFAPQDVLKLAKEYWDFIVDFQAVKEQQAEIPH